MSFTLFIKLKHVICIGKNAQKPGVMVVHACNPGTGQGKAGGL
jgi:hypothetical protein